MGACKCNPTADPPQDCNWPLCSCDPAADKVIEAIYENDLVIIPMKFIQKLAEAFEDIRKAIAYGHGKE